MSIKNTHFGAEEMALLLKGLFVCVYQSMNLIFRIHV